MAKVVRTENLGKKINNSHVVFQVTKLIYEGVGDTQISRILNDRYSFKVSVPSVSSFRTNHYETRLAEMRQFSSDFQEKQTGRIKTFIDESLSQAVAIKEDIDRYGAQIADLEKQLKFVKRLEFLFESAIDTYVKNFDPANPDPTHFLENQLSPAEQLLHTAITNMGPDGLGLLTSYLAARSGFNIVRYISSLRTATLNQRNALVKIHRDVFKGYRNFSIMQELVGIFEKYNALIVEEFFPDRTTMDKAKYFRIRKRILALFDEFQIRYQGVDNPSEENDPHKRTDEEKAFAAKALTRTPPVPNGATPPRATGFPGGAEVPVRNTPAPAPASAPETVVDPLLDELQIIPTGPNPSLSDKDKDNLDHLFSTLVDQGNDIVADFDAQADRVHGDKAQDNQAMATTPPVPEGEKQG